MSRSVSNAASTPHGIIPALVTPLDEDGSLLEDGLRRVLDHVIEGGSHGVFVLGSSGEIYGLSDAQKQRVVEITVEHVDGRVPVYAGASEITTRDCIRTARMVESVGGVDALSVLTPYFMTPTQGELITHFTAIADSTELPVILYNNPGRTHVDLEVETVLQLAQVGGIIGLKDSSGDLPRVRRILAERPEDFCVLMGLDSRILAALEAGADGAIASTGNVAPHVVAGIYEAFRAGDRDRAAELQEALAALRVLVDRATFPLVLKEGLRVAGIDAGTCIAPAREVDPGLRDELRTVVEALSEL
ncbi:4-hydroxy-tetrahydrodipicolinate synthase [Brachybacterium endophyticum]|uniref:4-hydroxy-tetrahydrodipicolinate synthase n=1 Tax=Brachybacterium endophyticum TaxID=2182385 RepID=A0A2U2RN64_9MICO|nr:4-hydroxy-tetrahydrodipicolinate synthase [Brachybacterium endophyticum]PWH07312.1 4-hydroxy-tetrahydrodipicolinate synthase [Brachybacterium endophyticum]